MKRLFEDSTRIFGLFEIVGIFGFLVLLLAQVSVMGIPLSQLAGIGTLYIALFGAFRRLSIQQSREDQHEENPERERRKWEHEVGLPLEESDSQMVVYNVYGENAYIDARQERRERSDRALDHTPVEKRALQNRNLDEFESERAGPHQQDNKEEQTPRETVRFVHEKESEEEREHEFDLERE
ncbi:hypothetical protein [Halopelagius longus]|uniref:hypothetical protein n=1 Tax=Halopelagius longus TaxID=1236180 RepID=UPI001113A449|nr:hypothetical protein [Halopelagius longus]